MGKGKVGREEREGRPPPLVAALAPPLPAALAVRAANMVGLTLCQ